MSVARCKILIADGSAEARAAVRRALAEAAPTCELDEVATGADAVRACRETHPDCLVIAAELPDGDALAVLGQLRERARMAVATVVMVAQSERALERALLAAGAQELLELDALTPRALLRSVERAIDRRALPDGAATADEERFRLLADAMPQLVWMANADGVVDYYNSRAEEYDGLVSRPDGTWLWHPVVHPADVEHTDAAWQQALETRSAYTCEHRVRTADGSYRWHLSRAIPVEGARGELRWFGTATDIHELKCAEEAALKNEELFHLIGLATNDVIWDWHLDTGVIEWNDAAVQHFGDSPDEIGSTLGTWAERLHPEDRERVVAGLTAAIEGGAEGWSDEYRFRRRDGSYATFLDRGHIARDADGRPYRMIGSMLDLTERRSVEAALRESEARFRALADNIAQLAWIANDHGDISWFNERWFEFTGTTPEQMQGWGWQRVHHPDHVERVVTKFRRHLETGEPWEDTFPLRAADGSWRWFLSRAQPIRDASGHIRQWFGTNTDITAQRDAEEALREADRRKDAFLAMLAHELRNPLAPVRTAVEIMRRVGPQDATLARAREVIDRQVGHLARLIDDLLDVSRIARGKIRLKLERCDVAALVRQTVEDYRPQLEAAGLTVTLDVPDTALPVDGDPTRLAQMVANLLHNAGKFTPAGGHVDVAARADDGEAVITVADDGDGIAPELLGSLFDTFSQASQGLDRSKGGLGLGLALVKGLVELHGGSVVPYSEGPGRGATFTLRVPLAAPAEACLPCPVPTESTQPMRVVIIEDNQDAAETLEMLLSLLGHHVETAFDGRTGIETVRSAHPDVVLCDIGLPDGTDGYDVARALRAESNGNAPYLVALSGYGLDEDRRRSREAGFDVHLVKPVNLDELVELIGKVAQRS